MAKYVFGIDLGTTYSCIAYVDETGNAVVVKNQEGSNTTPSVVNFADPSHVVVGQVAKETAVIDPQNTVALVKTLMGKSNFAINYNGEDLSPEYVSNFILRKVSEDASKALNTEVKDVVITCPAYFGTAEAEATKQAGIIAGLNVIEIIREPTAAAICYGVTKAEGKKTILVYDLGGGTFDVTVMSVDNGNIEVICSDGNHQLGGKDWDTEVMNYLATQFCSETGFDGDFDEYAQQDLRLKAEKAKQQLTAREEVPVMLDAAGLRARVMLSRATFDDITQVLLNETIEKTDAAIAVAESKGYKIDEILLCGGSTRMPQVEKALTEKYGISPQKTLDPDEAVAKGAAIYALLAYNNPKPDPTPSPNPDPSPEPPKEKTTVNPEIIENKVGGKIGITFATTKSYALEVLDHGELKCRNMIIKDEKMDNGIVSVTKQFGTAVANQETADLVVYESDFKSEYFDVDEDYKLGSASLELPGNLPENSPLEVTFTLNNEGILSVTGVDITSGKEIHATMQATAGTTMSKEDVAAARAKSNNIVVQ